MSAFVLDASTTLSWCFEDEASEWTDSILNSLKDREALVPSLWTLEIANALALSVQKKRLKSLQAISFLKLLNELPIRQIELSRSEVFKETFELSLKFKLTSYDACYLYLAKREKIELATADKALQRAARSLGLSTL